MPDPLITLPHLKFCDDLTGHVEPIGFDEGESEWDGESHGESDHPDRVGAQCMCGHPDYQTCPDWLVEWRASKECGATLHHLCDRTGWNVDLHQDQPGSCPCDCHAVPLPQAIEVT